MLIINQTYNYKENYDGSDWESGGRQQHCVEDNSVVQNTVALCRGQ
jgi:hypothetical protein